MAAKMALGGGRGKRAPLTAAQQLERKQHELFFRNLAEQEHARRVHRVRQLEDMWGAEERVERRRITQRLQDEEHERRLDDALRTAEENKRRRELELQQEEQLAAELAKLNHDQLKDEKMRQQIRETSVELRELERKLKSAYMNKERAAQIAERDALKYEQMKRDAELARAMQEEWERADLAVTATEKRRNEEQMLYQRELEKQLEEQEKRKQAAYEEFLRDKLLIDAIVRKIYDEDARARQEKLEKKRMTQRFIEEFKKEQALRKQMQLEEMERENEKILAFANLWQQREDKRMAQVHDNEERKRKVQQMIVGVLEKEQREREELEQVREEFYLEERAEADRKKEVEEMEKKIRQRLELQRSYEEQLALREVLLQAMKEEEAAFRQTMLAKFAEDDRIEQMNTQRRRMKQLEHQKAVQKLIEDRRKQFLADKERELEERQLEERRAGAVKAIVEEERRKLLQEHAVKLLGFLPRGVLKDEQDVDMLGEEFKQVYQKRKNDGLKEENGSESTSG